MNTTSRGCSKILWIGPELGTVGWIVIDARTAWRAGLQASAIGQLTTFHSALKGSFVIVVRSLEILRVSRIACST